MSHIENYNTLETQEQSNIKQTIDTSPLKSGGSNFKTNKLKQHSSSVFLYKPTIGFIIFASIFAGIGYSSFIYGIIKIFTKNSSELFLILFGAVFGFVGTFLFYEAFRPRVFDKSKNIYYQSYKIKNNRNNSKIEKNQVPLNKIVALQIIGEHIRGDNRTYPSFELNLVLSNNTRRNVVDHGNLKSVVSDAQKLSDFLNIPIWHSTSHLKD